MQITEQRQGAVTVVTPQGPLSQSDADDFKDHMEAVLVKSLGRFVIDVQEVPFVDSRGLEVLLELSEDLAQSGRSLKICGVNETVREVLDLTELATLFERFADATTAVGSFA